MAYPLTVRGKGPALKSLSTAHVAVGEQRGQAAPVHRRAPCENPRMPKIYEYVRHPRADELRASEPIKTAHVRGVDHHNPIVRLNARFGLLITLIVGTMWTAYLFTALALFALPDAIKQGTYFIVVWLSSSFMQLVLLPIIIVGQNIQANAADKRAEDT